MKKKVRHNIKKTFILSIALLLGMIINIFGNNIINSLCAEMLSLYVERNMPDEKIDLIGISYGYAIVLKNSKSIYDVYNKAEINMIKLKKSLKRSNIR